MDASIFSHIDDLIPLVAIVGGVFTAIIITVASLRANVKRTKEIEQSRREIAAYIAEGSMTPDDGLKLMKSLPKHGDEAKDSE